MKPFLVTFLVLAASACASDGVAGGGGDGDDTLPKRGEMASDPTIVSATADCHVANGPTSPAAVEVNVDASDPMGQANLGSCAAVIGDETDQGGFGEGDSCYLYFQNMMCTAGETILVDLTVSNQTGGVTTASVRLKLAAANSI